ncbi:MAG TPA: hypothetical protein VKB47_08795 [Terracidiphilus sp.]|nr:hypothetical protein [Terracidiphilus sp.]
MPYTGSKSQAGRGSQFLIGATPTEVGECSDVQFNRPEWDFADVTNLDSGSDQELLSTIRKATTINLKGNRVSSDAGQVLVETNYQSGAEVAFTLQLPKTGSQVTAGDKYVGNAFVKASTFDVTPTKQIEFNITLQPTGPITLTVGS